MVSRIRRMASSAVELRHRLPEDFLGALGGDTIFFNPSLLCGQDDQIFTFRTRCLTAISMPPREWLKLPGSAPIDLGQIAQARIGRRLKDPKLCWVHGSPLMTFNTGFEEPRQNKIFTWDLVSDEINELRFSGRRTTEKNWAPIVLGGEVFFLYSLSPLVFLREKRRGKGVVDLEEVHPSCESSVKLTLSLGTPLHHADEGRFVGVAHEKKFPLGNYAGRLYLGRPFLMEAHCSAGQVNVRVTVGNFNLVHSWGKLFEKNRRSRANPNLLGCTYFSGISEQNSSLLVSYGVNDREAFIAPLDWGDSSG